MRAFKQNKNYNGTIRTITNDDLTVVYGLIGTVEDLLKENVLLYCECSNNYWAFIDTCSDAIFAKSKKAILEYIEDIN